MRKRERTAGTDCPTTRDGHSVRRIVMVSVADGTALAPRSSHGRSTHLGILESER